MPSVDDHYEQFLASHYTWMSGGHERQVAANRRFLNDSGIAPRSNGKALDIGCGSGFQSLALAELGFDVVGLDACEALLDELRAMVVGRRITPVLGDMRDEAVYRDYGPFEAAVCMGDTLVLMDTKEEVAACFTNVFGGLSDGGKIVLAFRDLSTELKGVDRIIPVRLEDGRLMATFLEYEDRHVNVHDMLFLREDDAWKMTKSAYKKLRLAVGQVTDLLRHAGFRDVVTGVDRGFVTFIARR